MDSRKPWARDLGVILEYMHEPVANSSSDESLGEIDDEETLRKRLIKL